jgi:hypothetical protein
MSAEQKITVELTEDMLRAVVMRLTVVGGFDPTPGDTSDAIHILRAALPPEYVRGALYRVDGRPGFFDGCRFVCASEKMSDNHTAGYFCLEPDQVRSVEPLRVLADDEIAVKRLDSDRDAGTWRDIADCVVRDGNHTRAALCHAYADALDAEAKP